MKIPTEIVYPADGDQACDKTKFGILRKYLQYFTFPSFKNSITWNQWSEFMSILNEI